MYGKEDKRVVPPGEYHAVVTNVIGPLESKHLGRLFYSYGLRLKPGGEEINFPVSAEPKASWVWEDWGVDRPGGLPLKTEVTVQISDVEYASAVHSRVDFPIKIGWMPIVPHPPVEVKVAWCEECGKTGAPESHYKHNPLHVHRIKIITYRRT